MGAPRLERRPVAIQRAEEHHRPAVRRPRRAQLLAGTGQLPAGAGAPRPLRARQQVLRHRPGPRLLHQHMRAPLVQPAIPVADGKAVVRPRRGLAVLHRLRRPPVRRVVQRSRIHVTHEQQPPAVRAPPRRPRPGRQRGHALRLAPLLHVEHVNLRHLVAVAAGRKRQPPGIRAPGRPAFRCPAVRELARLRHPVQRHQPEVRRLLPGVVGRLRHRHHRPASVRTWHRRPHPGHEPEGLVGDRLPGRGRRPQRGPQEGKKPGATREFHPPTLAAGRAGFRCKNSAGAFTFRPPPGPQTCRRPAWPRSA
jgi:hypothetical protein